MHASLVIAVKAHQHTLDSKPHVRAVTRDWKTVSQGTCENIKSDKLMFQRKNAIEYRNL